MQLKEMPLTGDGLRLLDITLENAIP